MPEASHFPPPPSTARTVSGATVAGDTITATTTTVSISRTVTPLFVGGTAGILTWAASITADRDITSAAFRVTAGTARAQAVRPGRPASAVLQILAGDDPALLQVVVTCPAGTVLTLDEKWSQQPRVESPIVLADPTFGDASPNGVPPPPASLSLPASEALSPARRSPQVRAAQLAGSRRPDLLPRQNAL